MTDLPIDFILRICEECEQPLVLQNGVSQTAIEFVSEGLSPNPTNTYGTPHVATCSKVAS